MNLQGIKGRPCNLQEAVAHATEVDEIREADNRKSSQRRSDIRMLGSVENDLGEVTKFKQTLEELKKAQRDLVRKKTWEEAS